MPCVHGVTGPDCASCARWRQRRETIATAVLAGLYTRPGYGLSSEDAARNALRAADALIAALDAQPDAVRSGS